MAEADGEPEPYPLRGGAEITKWKGLHKPPPHEYERVRFFIRRLMVDPEAVLCMVSYSAGGLPECSYVPLDTNTQVTWVVIRNPPYDVGLRCVMLIDIRPAPV